MTRRGFTEKAIALLLFCASVAWSALSVELNPRQPEQGTTFSFSLLLPTSELPAEYELPELQLPEGSLELLSSEAKEEERRDFFLGRYRVKRFHYQLKALQEGEHKVGRSVQVFPCAQTGLNGVHPLPELCLRRLHLPRPRTVVAGQVIISVEKVEIGRGILV